MYFFEFTEETPAVLNDKGDLSPKFGKHRIYQFNFFGFGPSGGARRGVSDTVITPFIKTIDILNSNDISSYSRLESLFESSQSQDQSSQQNSQPEFRQGY